MARKENVRALVIISILIVIIIGAGIWCLFFRGSEEERAVNIVKSYGKDIGGPKIIEDLVENRVEWLNSTEERDFTHGEWEIFSWSAEKETKGTYLVECEIRCEASLANHSYTYEWRVNIETDELTPLNEGAEGVQAGAKES